MHKIKKLYRKIKQKHTHTTIQQWSDAYVHVLITSILSMQ